jgi:hypothetical protein
MKQIKTHIYVILILLFSITATSQNDSGINTYSVSRDSLSQLKAILIVGPIEDNTEEQIENFKEVAKFLRKEGLTVYEFYDPDANWDEIKIASEGANFFIYSGHGTETSSGVGGLVLSEYEHAEVGTIISELKLNKNALVFMQSVCLAAGSSAGDDKDIGVNLALSRIEASANPFIKSGCGAYIAINSTNAVIPFLESFFNNASLQDIYKSQTRLFYEIEITKTYFYNESLEISVASSTPDKNSTSTLTTYVNGKKKVTKVKSVKTYDIAYIAPPAYCIRDLFK